MFNTPLGRLLIGALIAVPIILGLFLGMAQLINIKEIKIDEGEQRILTALTPQKKDQDLRLRQRTKPKQIETAKKPPPPPKFSSTKSDINLPTPKIEGAKPTELKVDRMSNIAVDPVAISDRDAQPIRPPAPTFPQRAAERGISGSCDVRFDVDTRGKPYNIVAQCSSDLFKQEAERAVGKVEFAPKVVRGKPAERKNVVYPLEFKLE
jgi:periplasmic protein TonB